MNDWTPAQVAEYLRHAAALERSLFQLRAARREVPRIIRRLAPAPMPCLPPLPPRIDGVSLIISAGFVAVSGTLAALTGSLTVQVPRSGGPEGPLWAAACLLFALLAISFHEDFPRRQRARYRRESRRYEAARERERERRQARERAADALRRLDGLLRETQALLAQYYALDVIPPKCRSRAAVTALYGYFAFGRRMRLTGPDGARALYAAERRRRYPLCRKARERRREAWEIRLGARADLDRDAGSGDIAALCAQVTAQNTEAIQYLTLING